MSAHTAANGLQRHRQSLKETSSERRKNNSNAGWVVQKFGGTSVGKFAVNIAEDIVRASLSHNKIAVVCSARSTGKKVEGTTSRLLEIYGVLESVNSIKDPETVHYESLVNEYERLVHVIADDHVTAADSHIQDETIRAKLIREVRGECQEIIDYRHAAERWHLEIDSRSKDRIISFGEKLSCRFIAALLQDRGVESEYVDLSDIIHFKTTTGLNHEFYNLMAAALRDKVLACEDRVPILTGYFGTVPGGLMDGEIGRGYTDLCAALVAVGINADELQVWKEVDGIFTADPSKVPTARLLATITPSEAAELTFYGSEVIHHLTMDQVIHATPPIRIRIKNVKNPRGEGTIVLPDPKLSPSQLSHNRSSSTLSLRKTPKRPTAVTIKDKISVINVHSNKRSISHGFFAKVFSILDRRQLSVDLISTSEVHVSMAIHSANISAEELRKTTAELELCGEVSVLHDMAILSLVGAEMKNMIGIAGRMFSTLGEHNVNIEMISQGASEINISCVIDAYEATRAMNVLHTNLFTFLE
ncbi:Carbamate kinase-like protein [Glarea lozoyensis ATCC 20868]|uniref:Aspartokinase n=1 Tax=Glarea lozoyensis (strain ATCC 20868 / MF5171) TaxID=1116229 RepID=S3D6D5_GLAL2|nr:Carbamate kinase-like protein [Glarea lozoyensis ATCC 20868]EPE34057.1 Carbamate kinase-like protein [Glarea lozoyensis ATCC 20868]